MSYLGTKPSNQTPTYKQVYEFTATAGQTTFSASYTVGFVSVFRNGVQLNSADYTATSGTSIVLTNACTLNDAVRIESTFTANVQGAIPNTAGAVVPSNLATGTDFSINGLTVGKGGGAVGTNTAVGASALSGGSQTGAQNTAIGGNALKSNTSQNYNTVVGYNAAQANTTGSVNAFGVNALYSNTTGAANCAFGSYDGNTGANAALYLNTTGGANSAFGVGALASNTTASYNTAVGYQAGYSYAGSGNALNVFYGIQAGYTQSSGTFNTYVGPQSGYYMTTGSKNTILGGYNGNQGGLNITTASNHIVLSDGDGNPRGYWNGSGTFFQTYTYPNTGAIWTSNTASSHYAITFNNSNGQVGSITTAASATAYNTSSDYRLKENVAPMTGALARVAQLKPVTYQWKIDGSHGEGFIAHELAEVVAGCVTGEKDAVDAEGKPVYQGIDTSFLVATLTAAIQELKADLDSTKAELAELKGATK